MTKNDIIKEIFAKSPELAEYLCDTNNYTDKDLLDVICGAPISLHRKLKLLQECATMQLEPFDTLDLNEVCDKLSSVLKEAILNLEETLDNVFNYRLYRYCPNRQCGIRSSFPSLLSLNEEDLLLNVKFTIGKYLEDKEKEEADFLSSHIWFEAEKWEKQTENGARFMTIYWTYTIIDEEICYFRNRDNRNAPIEEFEFPNFDYGFGKYLNTPFEDGDIVKIDCRPFSEVIIGKIFYDGTDKMLAFIDSKGEFHLSELEQASQISEDHFCRVSPFYNISLYKGDWDDEKTVDFYLKALTNTQPTEMA